MMPLAMHYPDTTFVGIDARQKKAKVVNQIIEEVGISNAKALWTRAEDHKEQYDVMVTRAVAYVDKLLNWSHHLVKK